ncbi:MAG: tryptophan 7-halogenase [Haliea sp.]|nr:tryptophan 7-halogenase [Haliea sp.]
MSNPLKKILVVGGGTAGWLTAAVLAAAHDARMESGIRVTLIESPDVSTIGVGEGTWPSMRDTLSRIGVSERDFIRECSASFKQGSKFVGWRTGDNKEFYYHPFSLPQGYLNANLVPYWQAEHANISFASAFSSQEALCQLGKAPKQPETPEFAAVANYAYHLDAGKFATFLRQHCTQKLGVQHVLDHVTGVNSADSGDIASLSTRGHGDVVADLFIDCTGIASLLLGRHFGVPFVSKKEVLFNDRAVAMQVPYAEGNDAISSATIATAQRAGWIWDIGLPSRRGVGYVYSSNHASDEEAEETLRSYVKSDPRSCPSIDIVARKLSFNPGFRKEFWHRNCVAVGMSAGFIEPLEASAIALVELSAAMIRDQLPANRRVMETVARRFNQRFSYHWERVIEFLKLHYVLSSRSDSEYWRDHRREEGIPRRLTELLELWQFQPPSRHDFLQAEEIFPSASYQYVLYGMGFSTHQRSTSCRRDSFEQADRYYKENKSQIERQINGLPSNRELINHLARETH